MPRRTFAVLILAALVAALPAGVLRAEDVDPEAIDALFAAWDRPGSPGCAVGVYRDGEVLYAKGYGLAQLEYDIPNTPQTVFHVASVSKQFTDFAIAMLADQGKLSLDDEVRTHVPELPDFDSSITIRHLVHHVSGLRDQWDLLVLAGWRMDDVITRDDVMDLVARQRDLNFPPGDRYTYCNTGYTLLGLIVERVSGMPFPDWCEANIFEPLGMRDTHFHDDHQHVVPNRAYSYRGMRNGDFTNAVLSYAIAGATSLFTTVDDLAKWQHNFSTAQVGGEAVIEQMFQRGVLNNGESIDYAFGLSHGTHQGLKTIGHSGGDAGFSCNLVRFPEQGLSVAVLGNTPIPAGRLTLQVAELLLAEEMQIEPSGNAGAAVTPSPAPLEPTIELPTEALARFAGRYAHPEQPRLGIVTMRDDRLHLEMVGQGQAFLRPVSPTSFRVVDVPVHIEIDFVAEGDGPPVLNLTQANGVKTTLLPATAPTSDNLREYAGRYHSPELDVSYIIEFDDDTLTLVRRKYGRQPLQPIAGDRFSGGNVIEFTRGDDEAVDGVIISTGRVFNLVFNRMDD